jgi:tRNA threonylcarbamoyladenosine biosynthesis protein TsaB
MSWIIGIDTSSVELSIGLVKDSAPFLSFSRYNRNSHAEHISDAITFMLNAGAIGPADITHAAIATGPGSFTGLRIGISFLKGFLLMRNIPVLPVSSLHSMAVSFLKSGGSVMAAIDARQGNLFCARFKRENGRLIRISDDALLPLASFMKLLKQDEPVLFDTLGNKKNSLGSIRQEHKNIYPADEAFLQRGIACAHIAAGMIHDKENWQKSADVFPNYLQPSYAESKLAAKSSSACCEQ